MTRIFRGRLFALACAAAFLCSVDVQAAEDKKSQEIRQIVDAVIQPLMAENAVPGMAVAVAAGGDRYVFNYGLASKESGRAVTDDTIFEIGSVSKTFTATLAADAAARGALSLSDKASRHLPALSGTAFDEISLLDLGTYAAGGLPLQFPDEVTDRKSMIAYYRSWRPSHAAGTTRLYSNPSIGLFGLLAAESMGGSFETLMEDRVFSPLGLENTFMTVPEERMEDYAFGYSEADKPIRVTPGVLDLEAYGVKTTAADLIRFVEANMGGGEAGKSLRRAFAMTQAGYFTVGGMTQGLGWEMYDDPADLDSLLAGNSAPVVLESNAVTRLDPPRPPQPHMLVNKTGSTNGFGAYVAFVRGKNVGVVMLANRNYPGPARVKAGHDILTALGGTR